VPGCSTGEEVYSLAIALLEFLGDAADTTPIQIFGTDVNPVAIERARLARYVENVALDISPERLRRFFVKIDEHYEVAKRVRDMCIFATQNVGRDPPFSRLDLVSCRNVLIYLDSAMQKRVIQVFHYALLPDRFLLLGPSETIGQGAELFDLIDKKAKIYRRAGLPPRAPIELPPGERTTIGRLRAPSGANTEVFDLDRVQKEADHLLLARYAPAAILIDAQLNVLQFRGRTGPYLEHQPGAASLQLQKLIHPSLLVELSTAIAEARKGQPVRRERVRVQTEQGERRVNVEVIPLKAPPELPQCLLVLFEPVDGPARPGGEPSTPGLIARLIGARGETPTGGVAQLHRERDELKAEVEATRAYLH
jgi:two-component system CheB/CheR fusion protein